VTTDKTFLRSIFFVEFCRGCQTLLYRPHAMPSFRSRVSHPHTPSVPRRAPNAILHRRIGCGPAFPFSILHLSFGISLSVASEASSSKTLLHSALCILHFPSHFSFDKTGFKLYCRIVNMARPKRAGGFGAGLLVRHRLGGGGRATSPHFTQEFISQIHVKRMLTPSRINRLTPPPIVPDGVQSCLIVPNQGVFSEPSPSEY